MRSENFYELKRQKDAILAKQKAAILATHERCVCIGMDALRICLGLNPKTYTMEQVLKHMRLMAKPTDGKE